MSAPHEPVAPIPGDAATGVPAETPGSAPREASAGAPATADAAANPPRSRLGGTRTVAVALAALVLVALAAVWLDARRAQQDLRREVAQRLTEIEAAGVASAKAQGQLAADLRDALAKITLLEARLAESQSQQAALEALYRDLAPSRDEIALTEIEQVLLVASQQLMLAGNVSSALAALQLADARLQRLERPQFMPLRRALTRDMDRLKAMPFVDVQGMSLKLDQAIATVATLPFAMDERLPPPAAAAPPADEPTWRRALREMWNEIRQLVRIEIADRPAAPLLAPSQQYFLRENLRLRLLAARIALLNRDDASFKADLTAADAWLKLYFDTRTRTVQTMQATLKQLAATPMGGDMPDLGASLAALRVLRLAQERAPARAPERAAPTAPRGAR